MRRSLNDFLIVRIWIHTTYNNL